MLRIRIAILSSLLALGVVGTARAQPRPTAAPTGDGIVRAVLFYSENCPHCSDVIYRFLPPIQEEFGSQLQVVQLKTQDPLGNIMYKMAQELYMSETDDRGVPWMVIDNRTLMGSVRIRDDLPGLTRQYLAAGGLGWPAIPGLAEAAAGPQPTEAPATEAPVATDTPVPTATRPPTVTPTPTTAPTPTATPAPSVAERLTGSALGRGAAVLLALVAAAVVVLVLRAFSGRSRT